VQKNPNDAECAKARRLLRDQSNGGGWGKENRLRVLKSRERLKKRVDYRSAKGMMLDEDNREGNRGDLLTHYGKRKGEPVTS